MNLPNPHYLLTLRTVLSEGSFTAAAKSLGYTPSAVSQQIAALERSLGLRLFDRRHSAIHATEHARRIADLADIALDTWQQIIAYADNQRPDRHRAVRVGTFTTAGARLLPRALATVSTARPDVVVSIQHGEPSDLVTDLVQERIDLAHAFAYTPLTPQWPSGIEVVELLREEIRLAEPASSGTTSSPTEPAHVAHLRHAEWISTEPDTGCSQVLEIACAQRGFKPHVVLRTNDYDAMQALVAESLGVALIPALAVRAQPDVHHRPIADIDAARVTVALFRRHESRSTVSGLVRALESASHALVRSGSVAGVSATNHGINNLIA